MVFLTQNAGNPELTGMKAVARARKLGKMYRSLAPKEKKTLFAIAARTPVPKRKPKLPRKKVVTGYMRFVRREFPKVRGKTPSDKLRTLAKRWQQLKKKSSN